MMICDTLTTDAFGRPESDVVKPSEIEGEQLNVESVRSTIKACYDLNDLPE